MTTSPLSVPLGSQLPRLCTQPASVSSETGNEAVNLAKIAGLDLDPWQQFVVRGAFATGADGRWAAKEVGLIVPRQNGKGSVLEAVSLAYLFLFGAKLTLHSAHEFKTAKVAYRRIRDLIHGTPDLLRRVEYFHQSNEDVSIGLKDGSTLRFVARSTGSTRGFTVDGAVLLDEAYNLSQDAMSAMLPTTMTSPNSQFWFTSSAGMETSEVLAQIRERGRTGSPGMAYFEWSAPDDADLDDRAAWAQANPGLGIRIDPAAIETMRGVLDERGFAREHLGIWHDPGTESVVDVKLWSALADRGSAPDGRVAFAVDVAPDRRRASIAVAGRRADGNLHLEVANAEPGVGWVVDVLAAMVAASDPVAVVVDAAGPAGSLIPDLEAAGLDLMVTSSREMGQACGAFFDAVTEQRLRHIDSLALNTALGSARRRPLGDSWAWARKDSTVDITPLVAATLALYGFAKNVPDGPADTRVLVFRR